MSSVEEMKIDGNKAIEITKEKYKVEMTPSSYEMSDYLSKTDKVHCYTDGMDTENEHVEIYIQDGKVVGDNYFSYYICPQVEAYIGDIVGQEFSEFKVYRSNEYGALPNELTCESTLEDLYRVKSDYWMDVKVYINGDSDMSETQYEEKIQKIEQKLLDSNHRYTIYIFAVSDAVYQSLERYKQDEFWRFYAENREPDGDKYYYLYKATIVDGEVK